YTEMYGFPLTIYLLTAWLGRYPVAEPFAHAAGNLWATLLLGPWSAGLLMGLGGVLILAGVALVISGWRSIYATTGLVTDGIYATMRHPQYAGIGITILGAPIEWPTLLTLVMVPVLLASYILVSAKGGARPGKRASARPIAHIGSGFLHSCPRSIEGDMNDDSQRRRSWALAALAIVLALASGTIAAAGSALFDETANRRTGARSVIQRPRLSR
ncbi:MAG: methyltransferase family protein, partial [Woeseiaceae bacterium]